MQYHSIKMLASRLLLPRYYSTPKAALKLWVKNNGAPATKVTLKGCTIYPNPCQITGVDGTSFDAQLNGGSTIVLDPYIRCCCRSRVISQQQQTGQRQGIESCVPLDRVDNFHFNWASWSDMMRERWETRSENKSSGIPASLDCRYRRNQECEHHRRNLSTC